MVDQCCNRAIGKTRRPAGLSFFALQNKLQKCKEKAGDISQKEPDSENRLSTCLKRGICCQAVSCALIAWCYQYAV